LIPSVTEDEADIVSFIISRASRKSPRQVKVLINSFIGYWCGIGMIGTAGADKYITPQGAAI
jgi:hypothetical protein